MERQVTWTMMSGAVATYTIELQLEREINLDGDKSVVPCCEIHSRMHIPGVGTIPGDWITRRAGTLPDGTEYVAVAGNKVALVADTYDRIMAARAEVESAPEWLAKQATINRNLADHRALNARRTANGYCHRCQSYCDGDCSAN